MTTKPIALSAALLAVLAVHSQSAFAASPVAPKAAAFCKQIQSALQPYSKIPLVLFTAEDSTNDSFHSGEKQYRHCQFRQADGSMIDIGMHDDSDGLFDDVTKNGYGVLTGYADKGRYTVRGSAGQKWLDLVRAKTACEARFALDDDDRQINHDWKEVGGKICTVAFTLG